MPHYFLSVRYRDHLVRDEEGEDIPSAIEMKVRALEAARDLMPKDAASWPTPVDASDAPMYPADLTIAMQAELATLADIEAAYAKKRHDLETWNGSQKMRERIVREVEVRHKRDREPHVLRLGELYGRIMNLTMFRGLRTNH